MSANFELSTASAASFSFVTAPTFNLVVSTAPAASLDVVGEVVLRRNAIRNPRLQAWVLGG